MIERSVQNNDQNHGLLIDLKLVLYNIISDSYANFNFSIFERVKVISLVKLSNIACINITYVHLY